MKFLVDSGADLTITDNRGVCETTLLLVDYGIVYIWITDNIYNYVQYIHYQFALFRDEYSFGTSHRIVLLLVYEAISGYSV